MKDKKLVSYCVFTYNQEKYIEASIRGALKQSYSPLEIIISDDCSSDSTYALIHKTIESYDGPHRIIVNRNETNLGIGGHVSNICYSIANGDYLILIGGDDISVEKHVEQAVESIEKYPSVSMVDFNAEIINEKGNVIREIELDFDTKKFSLDDYIHMRKIQHFAPGRIFKRDLIDSFNPISRNCPTEDTVFVLRSLLIGGFMRMNLPLVKYRRHSSNTSSADGLSQLSNFAIVSQFISDVLYLFNSNILNEKLSTLLLKRLYLELKIRDLKFSKSRNRVIAKGKQIYVEILRLKFLLENYFLL